MKQDSKRTRSAETEARLYKYQIIEETIPADEVGRVLGLDINSKGRCRCPFHNGNDRNMEVWGLKGDGHSGYNCFVCHANGNCISLARQLLGTGYTYNAAARWIDKTFKLNLFENDIPSFRERVRRAKRHAMSDGGQSI